VEGPLIPVRKEPVPKRGGLLSRIFCTGLISGTKAPLEPVLLPLFLLVNYHFKYVYSSLVCKKRKYSLQYEKYTLFIPQASLFCKCKRLYVDDRNGQ
jgi:hypothetical protein